MGARQSSRIAVADDCPIFADAAARILCEALEMETEACPIIAPFNRRKLIAEQPDLLILDPLFVRPLDHIVPDLHQALPSLRFFAFATQPTLELARFCIGLGFHGFLPKKAEAATLVRAVSVVAKGGHFIDKTYGRKLMSETVSTEVRPLTPREQDVLQRTSLGDSNREIARVLNLSPKTVDSHRARAMAKLGLSQRRELVRFAAANGWLG